MNTPEHPAGGERFTPEELAAARWWWSPRLRRRIRVPDRVAARFGFKLADDQTEPTAAEIEAAARLPGRPCRGCGPGSVEIVAWLGVLWYGIPWPKRIRLRWRPPFLAVAEVPGCGCFKLVKDLAGELGRAWRTSRRRNRLDWEAVHRLQKAKVWSENQRRRSAEYLDANTPARDPGGEPHELGMAE